jgi:hypothetical protein
MFSYASSEEETRGKLEYGLYYIKKIGFLLDLAILLKKIRTVLLVPAHKKPNLEGFPSERSGVHGKISNQLCN